MNCSYKILNDTLVLYQKFGIAIVIVLNASKPISTHLIQARSLILIDRTTQSLSVDTKEKMGNKPKSITVIG